MLASERLRRIQVVASSRLHFGLLAFGHAGRRQFGGVGVMLQKPPPAAEATDPKPPP